MIISVAISKGGVGKTTVAVNLAAEYSKHGKSVLVVDLDSQGNATMSISGREPADFVGSAFFDMIRSYGLKTISDFIHDTPIEHTSLIPSTAMTEQVGDQLNILSKTTYKKPHEFLYACLQALEPYFDVIIIDTPPARSVLTISALYASDYVIIPVKADQYCLDSMNKTLITVNQMRSELGARVKVLGIVLNMFDNTVLSREIREGLLGGELKEFMFQCELHKVQTINESTVMKVPAVLYKQGTRANEDFEALYKEVIERVAHNG